MMLDIKKLNRAIKILRDHCDRQQSCDKCIFYDCDDCGGCGILAYPPTDWYNLNFHYTALDYQAAELCKALGYEMIEINTFHKVSAVTQNSKFELPDYLFRLLPGIGMFNIDDILATKPKEATTND